MPGTDNRRNNHRQGDGREHDTDSELHSRLRDLKGRLGKAEKARNSGEEPDNQRASSIGLAFRLATELVVGLLVGGVIGWFLDRWLGTSPIMLLVFFALGAAAGILNVIRTAREMQAQLTGEDIDDNRFED
ncbi:MAG: AtpZ/AtpI family protein [Rhizobiales bacterium]|nr:AtpZ/AtpI family protein [Hyphomicrobiales bacterium]